MANLSLTWYFQYRHGVYGSNCRCLLQADILPQGFNFPLNPPSLRMLSFELLREIITIIMLAMVALIIGRNYLQRFSFFLYIFSIWDIFKPVENLITFSARFPTLKQIDTLLINKALKRSKGNLSVAAKLLGLSHQALSKRLKRSAQKKHQHRSITSL